MFFIGVAFAGDPSLVDLPETTCRDSWRGIINQGRHNFKVSGSHQVDSNGHNQEYQDWLTPLERFNCKKKWTILVYMQADNDLRPYAFWDIAEMESAFSNRLAGSTINTDVLIQLDTDQDRKLRRLHLFQSENSMPEEGYQYYQNYQIGDVSSPIVQEFDEDQLSQSQQQAKTFKDFIEWGMANYPSDHYMVIIWGHGQGWSQSSAVQFGGIATDDSDNQRISVTQIRESLKEIRENSTTNEKVDVLVSDACLMQTVEVASELGEESRFVIGSTQIQNFMGLPYRRLLYEVNSNRYLNLSQDPKYQNDLPYRMAALIPKLAASSFAPTSFGNGFHQGDFDPTAWNLFTMSSINAQELSNFAPEAFQDLSDAIVQSMREDSFISFELASIVERIEKFLGGSRDVLTFLAHLEAFYLSGTTQVSSNTLSNLMDSIQYLRDVMRRSVVDYFYGEHYWANTDSGYFLGHFQAVGVWLPLNEDNFNATSNQLKNSFFVKALSNSNWLNWMRYLYNDEELLLENEKLD